MIKAIAQKGAKRRDGGNRQFSLPYFPSPSEPVIASPVFLRHPCALLMSLCFSSVALCCYVCYLQPDSLNAQMFTNICRLLEPKRAFSPPLCLPIGALWHREVRRLTSGNPEPAAERGSAPRTSWLPRLNSTL